MYIYLNLICTSAGLGKELPSSCSYSGTYLHGPWIFPILPIPPIPPIPQARKTHTQRRPHSPGNPPSRRARCLILKSPLILHLLLTSKHTSPAFLIDIVTPTRWLSLTNPLNLSLATPSSTFSSPRTLGATHAPRSTVLSTPVNSTCENFIPGQMRGPPAQGAKPWSRGRKDSSWRAEEGEGEEIQREGVQESGEGKVRGEVCMAWTLREM